MDLNSLDSVAAANEGAWMEVEHPVTGDIIRDENSGEPWAIYVHGSDSEEFQQHFHRVKTRRLQARSKGAKVSSESLDADAMALVVSVSKKFQHIKLDGKLIDASNPFELKKVYERFPWLYEQVDSFLNDRSNFLGKPLKSSTKRPKSNSDSSKT